MAVCPSWPQPCIKPGLQDFQENSLSSVMGRASMSARRPTMEPLDWLLPRMTATTPVRPMPSWISSTPHNLRASFTRLLVYTSSNPSSGWVCRSRRSAVSSGWYCAMCAKARPPAFRRGGCMSMASRLAHAQARIDGKVKQIDHEVDHHEDQGNQAQVGGHHGNVGKRHRLDEQQAHARPLEHGLSDDGERDQATQLQTSDGHHRHQRVLEGVAEMDGPVRQTPRPGKLD